MSRRPIALVVLALATSALTACSGAAPTQPSAKPSAQPNFVISPETCRGGWNSSTGRCD